MNIAFQGETGAYSEEAVSALYPDGIAVPYPSFDAVFEAVATGQADRAVIPIENSLYGSVHQNYDLLREHDLRIRAEVQLRIRHQLLSVHGSSLQSIQTVLSHPQALGQCREFLKSNLPNATVVSAYDTAGAAKLVAESADVSRAAIASRAAATEYQLQTLASDIESNHENYTRFLALARPEDHVPEKLHSDESESEMKTSVLYAQSENVPGSLFKSLAVFALRDIDLLKIESRPLVGSPGKYIFYLDLLGHETDERVKNALHHLNEVAATVSLLGSYRTGRFID
ncbi:MAG: prephenate dehydratase [Rhodothermales bacterium]|jgi:prephenate dehydratase|nr:prephenate dehydratase [Rhodothermales bacterium]MDG2016562.1 prephenate dehydratase [Rhodothermales bacterium]